MPLAEMPWGKKNFILWKKRKTRCVLLVQGLSGQLLSSNCELRHDFQKLPAKFGRPSFGVRVSTDRQTAETSEFPHGTA
jgi:hypothetical protein